MPGATFRRPGAKPFRLNASLCDRRSGFSGSRAGLDERRTSGVPSKRCSYRSRLLRGGAMPTQSATGPAVPRGTQAIKRAKSTQQGTQVIRPARGTSPDARPVAPGGVTSAVGASAGAQRCTHALAQRRASGQLARQTRPAWRCGQHRPSRVMVFASRSRALRCAVAQSAHGVARRRSASSPDAARLIPITPKPHGHRIDVRSWRRVSLLQCMVTRIATRT